MKDSPILFSAPMVRAILDGKKTMTRRIYKPRFDSWKVGDRLWVRETYVEYCPEKTEGMEDWDLDNPQIAYRADDNPEIESAIQYGAERYHDFGDDGYLRAWKPSIFMPRKYSRLLLEITDIKREALRDISEADAKREGFDNRQDFLSYFEKINPKMKGKNPEVVAIGFKTL